MKLSSVLVLVRTSALLVVLSGVGACSGMLPDGMAGAGGNAGAASCSPGGTGGGSLANWSGVKTIIGFYCGGAGCHNEGQQPNLFPDNDATLYRTLREHTVVKCGGRVLVKPCAPEESAFYRAQAEPPMCEMLPRMPFGCGEGSCTSPDDLEGIRQWIANGALMN
jgi:hypothetical protein